MKKTIALAAALTILLTSCGQITETDESSNAGAGVQSDNSVSAVESSIISDDSVPVSDVVDAGTGKFPTEGTIEEYSYKVTSAAGSELRGYYLDEENRPDSPLYVTICSGECSTGGYGIYVTDLEIENDTLVVTVEETSPADNETVTEAFTYPACMVEISPKVSNVSVRNTGGYEFEYIEKDPETIELGANIVNGKLVLAYPDEVETEFFLLDKDVLNVAELDGYNGWEFSANGPGETYICVNRTENGETVGEWYEVQVGGRILKVTDFEISEHEAFDMDYMADIADITTYTEQSFPLDDLDAVLAENNDAVLTELIINVKGYAPKTVEIRDYTGYLRNDDTDAMIGEPVEISGDINGGKITFTLADRYTIKDYSEKMKEITDDQYTLQGDENTTGLLICYHDGSENGETIPLDTEVDTENKTLTAKLDKEGIYFVMDVFEMLDYLGIS